MSTYNGEKYLAEQIDSILAQEGVHVELFIRDDGSTDSTRNILTDYSKHYSNIHLNFGENLGCGKSFITELNTAPDFEYYAFSDQDDYWKPRKLISAVKAVKEQEVIHSKELPVIYFSNLYITDKSLNIKRKTKLEKRNHSLEASIMKRNGVCGCTMVMNSRLREIIKSMPMPEFNTLHDTFAHTLVYLYTDGSMICDSEAYIFYRQHSTNLEGGAIEWYSRLLKESKRFLSYGIEAARAKYILSNWKDEFDSEVKETLTTVANHRENFMCRLKIVFSPTFRTGFFLRTLYGKIRAALGWL